jgi:formylglycine-generating enzyme required for sulfatase activity
MRTLRLLRTLILILLCSGIAGAAGADTRIALVIGIGTYQFTPELPTAVTDASAVGTALRRGGFDVEEAYDLDDRSFTNRLREFGARASTADEAIIFYAGHALQAHGQNYLLPANARLERERDLIYETVSVNLVLGELAQARSLGLLILDVGRDTSFAKRLSRSADGIGREQGATVMQERPVSPGMSRIDNVPGNTVVALATRAGALVEDSTGQHSSYALALLESLEVPGLELQMFFRRVHDDVMQATRGRQEPVIFGSFGATPLHLNPLPPNRNPELPLISSISLADKSDAVGLGIGKPTDPDGDVMFVQVLGLPRSGQIRLGDRSVLIGDLLDIAELPQITFKPDTGEFGDVGIFDFAVIDDRGGHAWGTVRITVIHSNRPPVTAMERVLRVPAMQLGLKVAVDPDGDPLTMTVSSVPTRGKVRKGSRLFQVGDRLTADDLAGLTYDLEQAAPGDPEAFSVLFDDGRGGKAVETVRIELAPPLTSPDLEEGLWQRIRNGGSSADLDAFLHLFPNSRYVADARERLAGLAATYSETPAVSRPAVRGTTIQQVPDEGVPANADVAGKPNTLQRELKVPEPQVAAVPAPSVPAPSDKRPVDNGPAGSFQDCPECPIMVQVPAGSFTMGSASGDGSERPSHRVTLARPFALGMFEVTVSEWRACIRDSGCSNIPGMAGASDRTPAHNLHWQDTMTYIAWLSGRTGHRYRLPSEAEWEYAAAARTTGRFWWGDVVGIAHANCRNCGGSYERAAPVPVGSFRPNPFGLHDMNGSVAEWVADCWNRTYRGAPSNGGVWLQGDCRKRVLRGGSWRNDADDLTTTSRLSYDADVRYPGNGVRVARDPD